MLMKFILELNGFPINQAVDKLDNLIFDNSKQVKLYQDKMKWFIFKHHLKKILITETLLRKII